MSTPIRPDGRWHYLVVTNTRFSASYPIVTYQDVVEIQQILASKACGSQVVITNLASLSAPA